MCETFATDERTSLHCALAHSRCAFFQCSMAHIAQSCLPHGGLVSLVEVASRQSADANRAVSP